MENIEKNLKTIATKVAENAKSVKSVKSVKYNEQENRIEIECITPTVNQLDVVFQEIISVIEDYPLEPNELYISCK